MPRTLTPAQIQVLKERCNSMPLGQLIRYVLDGEVDIEDLPNLSEPRKAAIENARSHMPVPAEQEEWAAIMAAAEASDAVKGDMLQAYISRWQKKNPHGNHLDEARRELDAIDERRRAASEAAERSDWEHLDQLNAAEMEAYLKKYPHSAHKAEIEQGLWGLVNKKSTRDLRDYISRHPFSPCNSDAVEALWQLLDKEDVTAVQDFMAEFPDSPRISDADKLLDEIVDWDNVRYSGDIFAVKKYIMENPASSFLTKAQRELVILKRQEIEEMKRNKATYDTGRLLRLIDEDAIGLHELVRENVVTEEIVDRLRKTDLRYDLPDISQALESSVPECPEGYTDVFFFGIPGTGKTCVLMGLACSSELNINLASAGGDYAEALQAYTDVGKTPPANPGDYVTTIPATVMATDDGTHRLNLVEMSGEEFAFEIARAEKLTEDGKKQKVFEFEQMGSGATKLLRQNNRKVFFLIIDPTVENAAFTRKHKSFDEMTGEPRTWMENCTVRQSSVLQRMINLFENPANADIMKKVDSIHVIVTKADLLGEPHERNEKAMEIIDRKYKGILAPLYRLGKEYNINVKTGYRPKLYTFSLGNFYVGGMYEYDNYDSNRLIRAIRNATSKARSRTWWDKFCDAVN